MFKIITKQNEWWENNVNNKFDEFVSWLGTSENATRRFLKHFVETNGVASILDTACGPCIDYEVLMDTGVKYTGIDSTSILVKIALLRGINIDRGNIENLPYEDKSFDLVYGRHILEHLEYYEKAIGEAIRCSRKFVMYTLFLKKSDTDIIELAENGTYANLYNLKKMQKFIKSLDCTSFVVERPDFGNQWVLMIEKKI